MRRGQMFSVSGNPPTMASGLPYAIAAQVAFLERQCVAFVGDGGFDMLMAEFSTVRASLQPGSPPVASNLRLRAGGALVSSRA